MLGKEFPQELIFRSDEYLPAADVQLDMLLWHHVTRPLFPDQGFLSPNNPATWKNTLKNGLLPDKPTSKIKVAQPLKRRPSGHPPRQVAIPLIKNSGLDDEMKAAALNQAVDEQVDRDVTKLLGSGYDYTQCLKACVSQAEVRAVRYAFKAIAIKWQDASFSSDQDRIEASAAIDYLTSPHLKKNNSRLAFLIEQLLIREQTIYENSKIEADTAFRIRRTALDVFQRYFQLLIERQVVLPTYQVDQRKADKILKIITDLLIKYDHLLIAPTDKYDLVETKNEFWKFVFKQTERFFEFPDEGNSDGGVLELVTAGK